MRESIGIHVDDGVACLRLYKGIFDLGTDLEAKTDLFETLEGFERSNDILAVLLVNDEEAFCKQEHEEFRNRVASHQAGGRPVKAQMLAKRQDNAFHLMHSLMANYQKPMISCLSGEIASPFLGLSLSADLRLASTSARFRFSHVELGLPPMGGLGFLLPRFLGPGRASELLIAGGCLPVEEALQLGLVNGILEEDSFESHCIAWAREKLDSGIRHFPATRRLLSYHFTELEAYLSHESRIRVKGLGDLS